MKTSHITFVKENDTCIKVLYDGNHVGNIWAQSGTSTPYPHDDHESTLGSIQICGFRKVSEVWACGVFHGTKDMVVEFNPMMDDFYKNKMPEYQRYVEECFKQNRPDMIKPFNDWVAHMNYPDQFDIRRAVKNE